MRKDQVDLQNAVVWIPDSKTPNGIAEVPLTSLAIEAFKSQMAISGEGPFLFPSDRNPNGHQTALKTVWRKTLRRAKVPYFRIYDLRSTYATRLSAGGVADEWVTQMLRQSDAQVFKKYSQMKLQMKREALEKLNRRANEMAPVAADVHGGSIVHSHGPIASFVHSSCTVGTKTERLGRDESGKYFAIRDKVGGREGIRTPDPLLAKQVLSQLSYTPTAGTAIDVKAFAAVRKLRKLTFSPLLCQNCVKTPVARPSLCHNLT